MAKNELVSLALISNGPEADPDFYKRLGEKCKQCPTQQLDDQEVECG